MNCRDTQKTLCEQPLDAAWLPGMREHVDSCPDCQGFARVLAAPVSSPSPSPALLTQIAGSIVADLQRVRPIASRTTYFVILAAIFFVAAAVSIRSLYPYGWEEMGAVETTLVLAILALGAMGLIRSLVNQMTPAGLYKVAPEWLPPLAVTFLAAATGLVFHFEREDDFWSGIGICLKIGLSFAVPTALVFWLVLRRGLLLSPGVTGASAGVLAGLVGASALEVHCPNLNAWHILLSHVGVAAVGGFLGLAIGFIGSIGKSKPTPFKAAS